MKKKWHRRTAGLPPLTDPVISKKTPVLLTALTRLDADVLMIPAAIIARVANRTMSP